jgi:hypothetical protein
MSLCLCVIVELKKAHTLFYKPFAWKNTSFELFSSRQVTSIEQSINEENWHDARQQSAKLIRSTLEGLRYLQT